MKKALIITAALFMLGLLNPVKAQDCDAIVGPYLASRGLDSNNYPIEKIEYFCRVSQNSFYLVNEVPEGAVVYNLHVLTNKITGQRIPRDFVVDLNTLSLWEYDFLKFQVEHKNVTIYFRLGPKNTARYLAVRNYGEALDRTNFPERIKD